MNRDLALRRDLGDPAQRGLADGVDRVRRERRGHRTVPRLDDLVERPARLLQQCRRPLGVGVVDQRRTDHRPQSGVANRPRGLGLLPVHVPEADRPRARHLQAGEPRAPVDVLALQPPFGRPDVLAQPLHQRQVVGVAAEQGHRRVGVGVDRARDQRPPAAVEDRVAGLRLDPGADRLDHGAGAAQPDRRPVERRVRDRQTHALSVCESSRVREDGVRDDLAEVLGAGALTEDEARPEAVERRHAAGGRTARENVADLVDPGSLRRVRRASRSPPSAGAASSRT